MFFLGAGPFVSDLLKKKSPWQIVQAIIMRSYVHHRTWFVLAKGCKARELSITINNKE